MQLTISGMFFQENLLPDLGFGSEGLAVYLKKVRLQTFFSGLAYDDLESAMPQLVGSMMDHYGKSGLTEVMYDPEASNFCFVKQHEGREDKIRYTFSRKEKGVWVGQYKGDLTGSGIAWCTTAETEDSFFNPEHLAGILDRPVFEMPE